jgi:hypothetical protein
LSSSIIVAICRSANCLASNPVTTDRGAHKLDPPTAGGRGTNGGSGASTTEIAASAAMPTVAAIPEVSGMIALHQAAGA